MIENIDIRIFTGWLLKRFYWFVVAVLFAIIAVLIVVPSGEKQYHVKGSLLFPKGGTQQRNEVLREFSYFDEIIHPDNEIAILTSFGLMTNVVDSLQLDFVIEDVERESYPLAITRNESIKKESTFQVFLEHNGVWLKPKAEQDSVFLEYGDQFVAEEVSFFVAKGPSFEAADRNTALSLVVKNKETVATNLISKLKVATVARNASLVELEYQTDELRLGKRLLNVLMGIYLNDIGNDKRENSKKTISFIEQQLAEIENTLLSAEQNLEVFQSSTQTVNPEMEGEAIYQSLKTAKRQQNNLQVELDYLDYLKQYLDQADSLKVISPSTARISDETLNGLISDYNRLNNNLVGLQASASDSNPQVITLRKKLDNTLSLIKEALVARVSSLMFTLNDLNRQIAEYDDELKALPGNKRQLEDFERLSDLNEPIYIYLKRRALETKIAGEGAYTDLDTKIVDYAYLSKSSEPSRRLKFALAIVLSSMACFGLLFVLFLNDKTIKSADELQSNSAVPFYLSVANKYSRKTAFSPLKERGLDLFASILVNGKEPTVSVSSLRDGESFIAANLAQRLSKSKKVALVSVKRGSSDQFIVQEPNKEYGSNLTVMEVENIFGNTKECIEFLQKCKDQYDLTLGDFQFPCSLDELVVLDNFFDTNLIRVEKGVTTHEEIYSIELLRRRGGLENSAWLWLDS